jgi:hypothetical protein
MSWNIGSATSGTTSNPDLSTNAQALEINYYGNWGGPGHGTEGAVPIDRLDHAYMDHDHDYGKRGYFDAPSDQIYGINALGVVLDPDSTWNARVHAVGAVAIFGALSPVSSLATTVYNPIKSLFDDIKENGLGAGLKNWAVAQITKPFDIAKEGITAIAGVASSAVSLVGSAASAVGDFFGSFF